MTVGHDGVCFDLKGHLMRVLSFAQSKIVPEVLLQHGSLLVLLDDRKDLLVKVGLVLLLLVRGLKLRDRIEIVWRYTTVYKMMAFQKISQRISFKYVSDGTS